MIHSTTPSRLVTTIAASSLVLASAGFGAVFAYQAGIPHGQTLAILSVVFAVSLELLKPLAVQASISAALEWKLVRSLLLVLLAAVAVVYSLTAELSLMAGSRSDHTASRQSVISSATRSTERYAAAKQELAELGPARLIGEIEADLARTKSRWTTAKLNSELARAKRKAELQAIIEKNSSPSISFGSADPGSSAIAMYLSHVGYTIPANIIAQWLYLVPVLALEIGSALSLVLVGVVSGAASPAMVLKPAAKEPLMDHEEPSLVQGNKWYTRDEAAKRLMQHLLENGGSLLHSEREIAARIGADRNTTRRAIQGLGSAGLLEYKPTKKGTELKLLA